MDKAHASITSLPETPGVYFFIGPHKEVLYVGKATSLKSRVRSYFSNTMAQARGAHMVTMVQSATRVEVRQTDSVLEALILESKLIRELKPTYNVRDKDDKSYNYLVITLQETFPRLLTVRGKDLSRRLAEIRLLGKKTGGKKVEPAVYGPFPHAGEFKEALKILRKIFPFYDAREPVLLERDSKDRTRLFNESIGLYPKSTITQSEYERTVRYLQMFFDGNVKKLVTQMEKDMHRFAKKELFEEASVLKRQLFAVQHIEDVSLIRKEKRYVEGEFRIEGYDVAHLGGTSTVGVMVVLREGVVDKGEYRTFHIREAVKGSDTGALKELLERRFAHPEWQYPRLIVLDGGSAQLRIGRQALQTMGIEIPIVAVTKDARHRASVLQGPIKIKNEWHNEILLANAEAHRFALAVHKQKRGKDFKR